MLTIEQKACNFETHQHINKVQYYINVVIKDLLDRANVHDQSKLDTPEVELFTELTDKLASSTFGSKEYNEFKEQLGPALEHHYAKNRHHPEHFKNGIEDMNLLDLIEMFCDWKASSLRHHNGNLLKSIEINGKRFNMNEQLIKIFENTAELIDDA
jgi:hypothetical protein